MIEDLTGEKFNKWTVIKKSKKNKRGEQMWLCLCECGSPERDVRSIALRNGSSKSCGCNRHGMSNTRIYQIYSAMLSRCSSENSQAYEHYGGRGITVCDEWRESFVNFYDWAVANGYTKELTIDRKYVNGNYEPSNCRWATMKEQANNRTSNHYIEINGEIHNIKEWAEISNLKSNVINARVKAGWTGEDLIAPAHSKSRNKVKPTKIPIYKTGIQSGVKGIIWNNQINKWQVRLFANKTDNYLGSFKSLNDAIEAKNNFIQ